MTKRLGYTVQVSKPKNAAFVDYEIIAPDGRVACSGKRRGVLKEVAAFCQKTAHRMNIESGFKSAAWGRKTTSEGMPTEHHDWKRMSVTKANRDEH